MQMNEETTLSTSSLIQFVFLWQAVKEEGGFIQLALNTLARVCVWVAIQEERSTKGWALSEEVEWNLNKMELRLN